MTKIVMLPLSMEKDKNQLTGDDSAPSMGTSSVVASI